ncbi:MAG: hypothetical protein IPL40_13930 [Proteobacteria bacterium]|nr:hypothetical protein [Pseudomonadota bacterium]
MLARIRRLLPAALVLCLSAALHASPPTSALAAKYAFDWSRIEKSPCQQIKARLLRTLKAKYTCSVATTRAGSGKPILARCSAKHGRSEYLVFESAADCNDEREDQLANAE